MSILRLDNGLGPASPTVAPPGRQAAPAPESTVHA